MTTINNKTLNNRLNRYLKKANEKQADSLSQLVSGSRFTPDNPRPSERALSEKMEYRLRGLAAAKRNANDAVSLLQTGESSLEEINNIITRMKEINLTAGSTTISDNERKYLFIEYEALHEEINRIATTTEFNGIPLLDNSDQNSTEELIFRVDDPMFDENGENDINTIHFEGLSSISATTESLGLMSAQDLLADSAEGIELTDVLDMMAPEDTDLFSTVYDQAINTISTQRAIFGAMQSRLNSSLDFIDVYSENIAAAKSRIGDTDYAEASSNLAQAKIALSATTSLMAHSNFMAGLPLQLIQNAL